MALRTPDFTVPVPRPSPIEQAFTSALTAGLTALVTTPFEKAAERRSESISVRAGARSLETAKELSRYQSNLQQSADINENYVEATDANRARLSEAGLPAEDLVRDYNGRLYIPKSALVEADRALTPLSAAQTDMFTTLQSHLQARGFAVPPKALNQRQLAQSLEIINPEIAVANLELNAQLRQDQLDLARSSKQLAREQQFYQMLSGFDPRKTIGLGTYELDANGNVTDKVVPLTLDQQVAYENPFVDVIASEQARRGEVDPALAHYADIKKDLARRGIVPLNFITREQINSLRNQINADPTSQSMRAFAELGIQFGIVYGADGKPLPRGAPWFDAAASLQANPAALEAIIATQQYHNMNDVINAEKVPGSARFDPQTLGYMQKIFALRGDRSAHPNAETPVPNRNTPEGILQGVQPDQTSTRRHGPEQVVAPVNLAPPTALIQTPEDSTAYADMAQMFANRFRSDPSSVKKTEDYINTHLTSPEAAVKLLRNYNGDQVYIDALSKGTPAQRAYALSRFRLVVQSAMQDAHESVFSNQQ
jgi:hypothetical protein